MACAALAVWSALSARAADALPPPVYAVKQQVATTGSNIPKNVVTSSKVPINRRYAELTPDEQEVVKSAYDAMRPLDEPPYPIDGLGPVFEALREVQRKVLAEGELSMFVEVDPLGNATAVSVMKSPDPKLTQVVASVLMLTKYKPAVCRGQPCQMAYPLRMSFKVER